MKDKNSDPVKEPEPDSPGEEKETDNNEELAESSEEFFSGEENDDDDSGTEPDEIDDESDADDVPETEDDPCDKLKEALQDANDKYIRLLAEYDNYRKRTAKEKTETYNNAVSGCIESILPVIDGFERSLEAECADENFKNGMMMIFNQFKDILGKIGVTEIESLGVPFDPKIHNAISQQENTEYEAGVVCAVYQKGYKLGDKLIRPAMVAVAQ